MMVPDAVQATGGAAAPASATQAQTAPAQGADARFSEALRQARSVASAPAAAPADPSTQALARAKALGVSGATGAYDVLGHAYVRIVGGSHDGACVNTSGNDRDGQTFRIVERDGHIYHVYADHAVRVRAAEPRA